MSPNSPHNECIKDGFDRQNLSTLQTRFLSINQARLERLHGALNETHQRIVTLLPLLFHCNHPMLPGFCGQNCPSKVSAYTPKKAELQSIKAIARSFTLKIDPYSDSDISGIYLMGSVGTIAQSSTSDIDIWLCHRPELDATELTLLQKKCAQISSWAQALRLEMHFFLMDAESFRQGKLSGMDSESSGSAQRMLLLDEFYRSSIYLAGFKPLWWYVPPAAETNYAAHSQRLLQQRYLPNNDVIDFGPIAGVPAAEFIGAAIWQLYKAIESPYKSVLKLLLLEVYVSDWPNSTTLALDYKSMIYAGESDINKLDSYVLIYRRIEAYLLASQQHKRLELARRCFYFKVGRTLSRAKNKTHIRPWQRELLQQLVHQWQWPEKQLSKLDQRRQWKADTVIEERSLLVRELNYAYQTLLDFAQQQQTDIHINASELALLGHKLQAAFEQRAGKIEWINPGISRDLSESHLRISTHGANKIGPQHWQLHNASSSIALYSADSLVELLLWCTYNGVYNDTSHLELDARHQSQTDIEQVKRILRALNQWLPKQRLAHHQAFSSAAQCSKILLLINSESAPKSIFDTHHGSPGAHIGHEENLVLSIDVQVLNSWLEVQTRRFEGDSALIDAACYYLQITAQDKHSSAPDLHISCTSRHFNQAIEQRCQRWFNDLSTAFYQNKSPNLRYAVSINQSWYCLQRFDGHLRSSRFTSEQNLIQSFGAGLNHWSPLKLGGDCLSNTALALIAPKLKRNCIQVFYRHYDIGTGCYVADEKGSIVHLNLRRERNYSALKPLQRFLRAIVQRQSHLDPELLSDFGVCPIYFFEVLSNARGAPAKLQQHHFDQSPSSENQIQLKAVARYDDNQLVYDFYCNDKAYSAREFGGQIYQHVANILLSNRASKTRYPIYLSDLDLSLVANQLVLDGCLQCSHYLRLKTEIEERLNLAAGTALPF